MLRPSFRQQAQAPGRMQKVQRLNSGSYSCSVCSEDPRLDLLFFDPPKSGYIGCLDHELELVAAPGRVHKTDPPRGVDDLGI